MTPLILLTITIAFGLVGGVLSLRRLARTRTADYGAVSTQWLSELRRDEPWTR
ncbi:MAG TPA: hypothetical protein VL173_14370 [Vicinamibacterales bacterium]|jgi:hypothetical protein|nr:hypothetical protein [Vicinamibacterales bacterium]